MTLSRETRVMCALFILTVLTRVPFVDPYLFNIDSGNFAFALNRFDVSVHQPHPPGYFLYIMLGKLARLFTGDANTALIAVSILFSALLVALVYLMGKSIYGHREGFAAAVIALTSPLLWFHGIVALSYAAEGFFSLAVAYLCYRIARGEGRLLWACAVVLGVAGGFRQNTLVFLLPLWLYCIRHQGARRVLLSLLVLALVSLCWFLPMTWLSGGYGRYMEALSGQVSGAVLPRVRPSWIIQNFRIQAFFVAWGLLAALIPLTRYAVSRVKRDGGTSSGDGLSVFYLLWLIPSLLFYVLIFSTANNPGYSLIYMVGLYLLAGRAVITEADKLSGKSASHPLNWRPLSLIIIAIVVINTLAFFMLDFKFSYRGLMKSNRRLEIYLEALRRFPPRRTVVLGSQHYYVSTRHAAYYLPEYTVYSVSGAPVEGSYFEIKDKSTTVSRGINIPPDTEYIVFFEPYKIPLPRKARELGAAAMKLEDGFYMMYFAYGDKERQRLPVEKILSIYEEEGSA